MRLRQVADDFSTRIPFAAETLFSPGTRLFPCLPDEGEFVDENGREGDRFDREFEECEKMDENFSFSIVYIYISSPSIRSKIYLTYNNSIRAKEIEIRTNLRTKERKIDGDGW